MINFPEPFKINYQHVNAMTGRLSSGGSKNNKYFESFNIQNVPREEQIKYLHVGGPVGYYITEHPYTRISSKYIGNMNQFGTEKVNVYHFKTDSGM